MTTTMTNDNNDDDCYYVHDVSVLSTSCLFVFFFPFSFSLFFWFLLFFFFQPCNWSQGKEGGNDDLLLAGWLAGSLCWLV